MLWNKDARKKAGGFWACRVKNRQRVIRWREANPEKQDEANARRIYAGSMYLGTCGFTDREREALLNGTTE